LLAELLCPGPKNEEGEAKELRTGLKCLYMKKRRITDTATSAITLLAVRKRKRVKADHWRNTAPKMA
jgi:hypothetical protein